MQEKLNRLIHFYNDDRHLFKTVTMYDEDVREKIFNNLETNKSWYHGRYRKSERSAYMSCRVGVEKMMYELFSNQYGTPPSKTPVYFAVFPFLSEKQISDRLLERKKTARENTKYLITDLDDIPEKDYISFTVEDGFMCFRKKLLAEGYPVDKLPMKGNPRDKHARLFHITEMEKVFREYQSDTGLYFEVQIWNLEILNDILENKRFVVKTL